MDAGTEYAVAVGYTPLPQHALSMPQPAAPALSAEPSLDGAEVQLSQPVPQAWEDGAAAGVAQETLVPFTVTQHDSGAPSGWAKSTPAQEWVWPRDLRGMLGGSVAPEVVRKRIVGLGSRAA